MGKALNHPKSQLKWELPPESSRSWPDGTAYQRSFPRLPLKQTCITRDLELTQTMSCKLNQKPTIGKIAKHPPSPHEYKLLSAQNPPNSHEYKLRMAQNPYSLYEYKLRISQNPPSLHEYKLHNAQNPLTYTSIKWVLHKILIARTGINGSWPKLTDNIS